MVQIMQEPHITAYPDCWQSGRGSRGDLGIDREELGRRIASARGRSGLSQAELADAVGLTQSAISRIEAAERGVDSLELAAMARHLGLSVLDLLDDAPLGENLNLAARVESARDPSAVDYAQKRLMDLVRFEQMLDRVGASASTRPIAPIIETTKSLSPKDQGLQIAEALRSHLRIGDEPIPDLFELAEGQLGLDVALEPLGAGISGLCLHTDSAAVALIDSSVILTRQRFTVAHELGHYISRDADPLCIDENLFGGAHIEIRANAFAAHFLMPMSGIARSLERHGEINARAILELQYSYGVSLEALLWHLKNMKRISKRTFDLFRHIGAKGLALRYGFISQWKFADDQRDVVRPPSRLMRRAFDAYANGLIGIERVAGLLRRSDPEKLRRELEEAGVTYAGAWPGDTVAG